MNKKDCKIIQINMIILSMLMFLSAHFLLVLKTHIESIVVFFGIIIKINIVIDSTLFIGFLFLFIVITIIIKEI